MAGRVRVGDLSLYLISILVLSRMFTCSLNYMLGGSLHETFCSRVWRNWARGSFPKPVWNVAYRFLDLLFFFDPDHCWNQYIKTKHRGTPNKWSFAWLWQTF